MTFNKTAENLGLPKIEEIEVKMGELAPYMQASLQKLQVGEIIDTKDNKGNLRLIMLCNIQKKYVNQHEWIKQKIFEQKVSTQSAIYFDNMRKNATIRFSSCFITILFINLLDLLISNLKISFYAIKSFFNSLM